jgi:uncharacterized protein (DUF433 family)
MNPIIDEKTHRIDGSRTTVYHVLDYGTMNWPPEKIVQFLPLSVEQVRAALRFIEEHKTEVMANYRKMLDRCARGNPPEVEAKLVKTREKMRAVLKERRSRAKSCV